MNTNTTELKRVMKEQGVEKAFVEELRQQGINNFEDLLFALSNSKRRELFKATCSEVFYDLYIAKEYEGLVIDGYTNTWGAISDYDLGDIGFYLLLENEEYGDETCYLLVRVGEQNGSNVFEVISETYDDIETALEDASII